MTEVVVRALLTADKVIKEDNGKHAVIGIFDRFNVTSFPATIPPWAVYVSVENLSTGKHTFTINLVHDETTAVALSLAGEIDLKEGSAVEMGIPVMATTLSAGGSYSMSLHVDGEHVATRMLTTA